MKSEILVGYCRSQKQVASGNIHEAPGLRQRPPHTRNVVGKTRHHDAGMLDGEGYANGF